jgi:chemotaxis protein methyltransferase CheR
MTPLRRDECKLFAGYIYSICGVQLDESKHYLIESRLSNLVSRTNCGTYSELYNKARSDKTGSLERSIIDAITTGETLFFRDTAPFELLRNKILPDLIDRRTQPGGGKIRIRIWSAASSTGQEIYSIAMVLRELLGPPEKCDEKYDIRLLGTDISPQAVARASLGIYSDLEVGRGLSAPLLARHFVRHEGGWKIRDEIRAMAAFRTANLLRDISYLGQFDIVFCRNVAIYFSEADKAVLFRNIAKSLPADGYLLIGSTESLTGAACGFEAKRYLRSMFYQPAAS